MKLRNSEIFEEDEAGIESRERQKQLVKDFDDAYNHNCDNAGRKLTNSQNTALFVDGTLTRLLLPPRTHHADCMKRVGNNIYVQIKKTKDKEI